MTRPAPEPLTRIEQRVLAAIIELFKAKGYAPSLQEIGNVVGLRARSTVQVHVAALEAKGYIRRPRGLRAAGSRAIEVLDPEGDS